MNLPLPSRQTLINQGLIETSHLLEGLRLDFSVLLETVFPGLCFPDISHLKITQKMRVVSEALFKEMGASFMEDFQNHPSDTIRGLVCYGIGKQEAPLGQLLLQMKPLANDSHFGVREWAWIALRDAFLRDLPQSLSLLEPWTSEPSERLRRFASELSRPRGVWCAHSMFLRQEPWKACFLLEPLKADPSVYVQKSVGNWLNDASKDHPEWVRKIAEVWETSSPSLETQRILKRGLRRLQTKR